MNAEQLQALINAMSAMTSAMQVPAPSVNVISGFDAFDPKLESFKTYKERLCIHLEIKKVHLDRDLCAKLLLQYIGAKNYDLVSTLAAPKPVNTLKYEEIIALLESYYCPKKNVLVEQHKFFCEIQNEKQTVSEYVAELRRRAAECEFICKCKATVTNIFLRAQFIRGLRDDYMREQLLQDAEMDFDKLLNKALSLEAAKINNKEISNTTANNSEINQINQNSNYNRNSKNTKINYRQLGIEGMCLRCGRDNHISTECKIKKTNLKCTFCKKTGHVEKVCIQNKLKANKTGRTNNIEITSNEYQSEIDNEHYGINRIIDIYNESNYQTKDLSKFYITVKIENKNQKFEVDSGAGYTLLPIDEFNKLNIKIPIQKCNVVFRAYTGDIFKPLGVVNVNVNYKDKKSKEKLFIVPAKHSPLLGRVWIRHLAINLQEIDEGGQESESNIHTIYMLDDIITKFSDLFQPKVGCIPDVCCSLKLQKEAKPVFVKHRQVPFALREKVEEELDNLERDGILTKVNTSNWGSPLVVIPKPDGKVRLCVDYKIAVNPQLEPAHYPIRRIDEILNSLKNSKYFCKLDLFKAYLHVKVDDESQQIQTISTHRGTYQMKRLSFGIKTAPSEFNRILDQILEGLKGTLAYFDDIIIFGSTMEECKERLLKCLQRLEKNQLHINKNKCEYFKTQIQYLGHIISHNKITKCPKKVQAITDMPPPQNIDQIRKFLGMVTYYARFIPNASELTFPLRQMLGKNKKFTWSGKCDKAFNQIKEELVTERVLVPFDEKLPIILACDASPYGIAAVLSHSIHGEERPIAFISRALTKSEQNYSQLDREALAIIFAVDKFFMYLHGREFTLISDNRPLTRIFHQNAKTPAMTSARLLRYASFLQGFNYKIQHRTAENNTIADCLSRAPLKTAENKEEHITDKETKNCQDQTLNQISTFSITAMSITRETSKDPDLSKLQKQLKQGLNQDIEFSLQDGIIFKNERIMIPASMRAEVLEELHHTHVGIVKMKQLARRYCYWKNIDNDIENLVRTCKSCALIKKNPPKVITHHWEEPRENFERVHIDYAGPFLNHYFLVLIDAKSKWPEVKIIKEAPTSEKTITLLENIFATHGLPKVIVSDNATIFQGKIFKEFCKNNSIVQKFIAPGHPATNGLAERHIQTLKAKLKAMYNENSPLNIKVQEILMRYRATPLSNNKSPAEMYLGRNLRTKLDTMIPIKHEKTTLTDIPHVRQFSVGERVQVQWHERNKLTWRFGIITQKWGRLHYQVKLDNGYSLKRHINQLYKSNVPKESEEIETTTAEQTKPKTQIEEIQFNWQNNRDNTPPRSQHAIVNQPNTAATTAAANQQVRRSTRIKKAPSSLGGHVLY